MELVPTTACHMVTATVLLDVLLAIWALLQSHTHKVLDIWEARVLTSFRGKPLMLALKAHHRIETEVAHSHTVGVGAFYLHFSRVQGVALHMGSALKLLCDGFDCLRPGAGMVPHAQARGQVCSAIGPHAMGLQTTVRHTTINLFLRPLCPANLARSMRLPTRGIIEQCHTPFLADRTNWWRKQIVSLYLHLHSLARTADEC
mmetsp:Transcript_8069/g.18884  ORF Transcript_8069/g.18884 Transcript_8069/m.18884 type:complete len:202 (+) Transcript_8069:149-754(+)|eukprot:3147044-Amphidinium_carterae.1